LLDSGELERRVEASKKYLSPCTICPRNCRANRLDNQKGICLAGRDVMVSSYNIHYGEEPPISGTRGSGTIFFTGCSLKCRFCQNYPISQLNHGNNYSTEQLADMMIELQTLGVHNINLVTPTHFVPHIIEAVSIAAQRGLVIPLVYNTSGYDSIDMLRLLDGIIDIYMPDIKYASDDRAFRYSTVRDYVSVNRQAIIEMHRQAGRLVLDRNNIAVRGMIVRHLILPDDIAQTCASMAFIAEQISRDTYLSLMNQYFPANNAYKFKELSRQITKTEYTSAMKCLEKNGLENGWIQE
jgi:putative pyruvate formate lyase activating enzyme